ncbi:hypothetical protein J7E96_18130 [Streptomyces sp. ISL-96]|uniref:hypothetical protein n=1 Tax=Streptomyces sp. ISL-96 TaxID=2819191 RepID=UPI001BE91E6E|nr:hypothetical protein [Streptomyces sp. ISL-96]MBT2490402.1 hypothetical protein [Streptomyces sp. ISL-96]
MYPETPGHQPAEQAVTVHQPIPIPAPPLVPVQPGTAPAVASVILPDGRVITGYAITPAPAPAPVEQRPAVSRAAVNIALGGIGFAAACGGLLILTGFIAALAAFVQQLIILAAVIFGGWIAVQALGTGRDSAGTTVNIRKAVIKRNHFHH